jgi:hypothetical protein
MALGDLYFKTRSPSDPPLITIFGNFASNLGLLLATT